MTAIEGCILPFAEAAVARLSASALGALAPDEAVVDLFCGAGGWGDGLASVGIRTDFAVNHDATAIEYHTANHPWCRHHRGDAWHTKPRAVVGDAKVGLLLASAACTTHSRARGSAPISKRVHMLGVCILRYMADLSPRVVMVENVPEWLDWGPLVEKRDEAGRVVRDAKGRALWTHDPARRGQKWRWWVRQCKRLGYALDWRVLDAADFGSASRRRRLFVILRRDGQPIVWPEATHGGSKNARGSERGTPGAVSGVGSAAGAGDQSAQGDHAAEAGQPPHGSGRRLHRSGDRAAGVVPRAAALKPHRSAAEVIDWSDLGTSIFDRKRPLADKTLRRIVEGVRRYVLNDPAPFVLRVTHGEGGGWHVAPVDEPLRTQTTRQDFAVATPVVQVIRGDACGKHAADPLPTITAGNGPGRGAGAAHAMGIATPIIAPQNTGVYGQRPDRPGPTITTKGHQALITPVLATTGYGEREGQAARAHRVSELLTTAVDGVKQALVSPVLVGAGGSVYAAKPVPADRPMGTVKCDDRRAVVTPVLMHNTTGHTGGPVAGPLPTVTTGGQTGLVAPVLSYYRHGGGQHSGLDAPMLTPTAQGTHASLVAALFVKFYGSGGQWGRAADPLGTVTTIDRHGLVVCVLDGEPYVIVDILFRMLRPHELAAAMGFRPDYIWPKSQRDAVRLIGNAVSPPMARALVGAVLPNGRRPGREVAA